MAKQHIPLSEKGTRVVPLLSTTVHACIPQLLSAPSGPQLACHLKRPFGRRRLAGWATAPAMAVGLRVTVDTHSPPPLSILSIPHPQ